MKLYTVIPLVRGVGKETLTYFGGDSIEPGFLVSIPLRKKVVRAIVVDKKDATESKIDIKSSQFALKKIQKVESKQFLSQEFLEAAFDTARFYAGTTGSVLQNALPELILEHALKIKYKPNTTHSYKEGWEHLVVQADDDERFAHYRGFIRGQFAKNTSVFFCVPTIEDARHAKKMLEKGIEQYSVVFHSGITKKEFLHALSVVEKESHPILIVATPSFLALERSDLGSIVLDRENSRSYRVQKKPYFDWRIFIEHLARAKKAILLSGDMMLSVESIWKQKNDEYIEFTPLKMRLLSPAEHLLVDMKSEKGQFEKKFRILSPELEALIDKTKEENERLFIFSARKGLAPTTVCGDCGQVVVCGKCKTPVTLYGGKQEENFFVCNKCGFKETSAIRCNNCNSWKLQTLGIGIELVEEAIRKRFPDVTLLRMDKEEVKTEKKALEYIEKFENTPGSVLLGTEYALFYLKQHIENVAVASIDSLLTIPDFKINEKIFYLLLTMRARAQKVFLIQTRNAKESVFEYSLKGNLADFYRDEIQDRKEFSYPPFSIFIKLTIEGKSAIASKISEEIKELFKEHEPNLYQAFSASPRGNSLFHIVIKRKLSEWPHDDLLALLRSLPPYVAIRVDPESLL